MELNEALRSKLIFENWRQGSIIEFTTAIKSERGTVLQAGVLAAIVTQTCDLLHSSFEVEKEVEILVGRWDHRPPPRDTGKSFRNYSLGAECEQDGSLTLPTRKVEVLDRSEFFHAAKLFSKQPSSRAQKLFATWLAERYVRPAFPDAFVRSLEPNKDKIKKALESLAACSGLFLALSPWDELERGQGQYRVGILLLMRANATVEELASAEKAHARLEALFESSMVKVESAEFGVQTEQKLKVAEYRALSKWHLDYLTTRDRSANHSEPPPNT